MTTGALQRAENRFGWQLVGPSLGVILLLILYPIAYNVWLSFFDVKLVGDNVFVGLDNYQRLLADEDFYGSVLTTALYLIGTVAGTTLLGLAVAILLNQEFPGRTVVRGLVLLPYFAPVISVVFGWQFLFDPVNGIVNHVLVEELGLFDQRFNLIANPRWGILVVVLFDVWKHFPIAYLLILSKLQAIPKDQYEAAAIDGYGAWGRFWHVTLPELYFVLGTIVILRFIWNLNKFEEVYLLAPNVQTLPVFTYYTAFTGVIDQGLAASVSVIQFLVLMGFIWFYVKRVLKW